MTISAVVTIPTDNQGGYHTESFAAWGPAKEAVRFNFNPSALPAVTRIKALTSLLVAEIDSLKARAPEVTGDPGDLSTQEIFTEARRLAVSTSMWAVLGATKGL
jgi:hypothetical protein